MGPLIKAMNTTRLHRPLASLKYIKKTSFFSNWKSESRAKLIQESGWHFRFYFFLTKKQTKQAEAWMVFTLGMRCLINAESRKNL